MRSIPHPHSLILDHLQFTGIQVVQRMSYCELLADETDGPVTVQDAFDGVTEEVVNFSTQDNTLSVTSEGLWKALWNEEERVNIQMLFAQKYSPICIKTLKNALHSKRKDTVGGKQSICNLVSGATCKI